MAQRREWICSSLDTLGGKRLAGEPTSLVTLGVADKDKTWPRGTVLRVSFLDGTPALHDRVLAAARQWLVPGVMLDLVAAADGERGDLRIAFDPTRGSWSYIGTDCRLIRPADPTMNLGWAALDTPEDDFSSVVVHEFGHALGLLHEHNHPAVAIAWNRAAVYADLQGDPNYWSRKTIDDNVFAKYPVDAGITPFDPQSVMIYTIPTHWTTDGTGFMPSPRPSDGDRATVLQLYGS